MSGRASKRDAVVTANGRSLPALMYSMDAGMVPNMTCTWPPSRSVSASASPRYGTWIMLTPAIILNSSPDRWPAVPLPPEPMLALHLGISNKLGHCLRRDGWVYRHNKGDRDDACDGCDVAEEVEIKFL